MPFANGQFISWADYLEANRPGVDQMEQKVEDKSGDDYASALAALHANGSEASAGAAAGGSGQPMDYGSYKTYLAKRRAVANTASYGANAQNPWDAALLEGTGGQERIQSHAKDELGQLGDEESRSAAAADEARRRYVQSRLKAKQQPAPQGWAPPASAQEDEQRTSQWNQDQRGAFATAQTGVGDQTQRLSNLDWMLKSGKISTADYNRAQTDAGYFKQLNDKYG